MKGDATTTDKAYSEYILKRCEEILSSDEKYNELCVKILYLESDFKRSLSPVQIEQYNRLEELVIESIVRATTCIYQECTSDIEITRKIG
jgi:hypothetical protein